MSYALKRHATAVIYSSLVVSTLLVFWQVHNFNFVNFDDGVYVYDNPQVLSGLSADSFVWALTTDLNGYWQPLTWLSLIINTQFLGSDPGGFHLVNVFLHIVNALLLFALLSKMTSSPWRSAFVAAAFALHPMHVESVAWISARKDVLSTCFLFLTLLAYSEYTRRLPARPQFKLVASGRGPLVPYLAALLAFLLGLLTKPMLVTLPFLLLLLDYWPLRRFDPSPPKTVHSDEKQPGEKRSEKEHSSKKQQKRSDKKRSARKQSRKKPPGKKPTGEKQESLPGIDRREVLRRVLVEKIPFFALSAVSSVVCRSFRSALA